jgi:RND family efflux transporter MFP subunit
MKKLQIILALVAVVILLSSCNNRQPKTFMGMKSQEKPITVLVQELKPGTLEKFVRITGRLEGITDVTLISETSGKVLLVNKQLGDWVEAGESIGSIDNSDYLNQQRQAEANLQAAQARLETARLQMKVSENLYKEDKISENEYITAKSSLKSAEASVKGAEASLASIKKMVANSQFTAPVSGYISELNLEIGEYVSQGKVVANIVDNKKLVIKTGVGESDISYIKKGNKVDILYNQHKYPGKITAKGIKPVTGGNNYPVEIELNNPDGKLLPRMIVEANIHTRKFENVIYTSIENLREKYDKNYVFVVNDQNKAQLTYVELGEKIANYMIIDSGLQAGDKLVIDGIDSLSDGSLVDVKTGF